MPGPARARWPAPVLLHFAGSLRGALGEMAAAFAAADGAKVQARFGASGLLRDEIAAGAPAEVFASANMEHPRSLADAGRSGPVTMFARNALCALVRDDIAADCATLLERMLAANVKLATSTPRADPSGDYAFAVLRKADAIRPGAGAVLAEKALQLTGGPDSPAPPRDRSLSIAAGADHPRPPWILPADRAAVTSGDRLRVADARRDPRRTLRHAESAAARCQRRAEGVIDSRLWITPGFLCNQRHCGGESQRVGA